MVVVVVVVVVVELLPFERDVDVPIEPLKPGFVSEAFALPLALELLELLLEFEYEVVVVVVEEFAS